MERLRHFALRYLIADAAPLSARERAVSAVAACLGILLMQGILAVWPGDPAISYLLAPLGATTVILFALPHSPLAQPWSLAGGLLISALIGYGCGLIVQPAWLAIGVALGASIWVTALLRYTASLENAGDVVCKTMIGIPEAMKKDGKQFSDEGKLELARLFRYLIGNTQLAAEVIMAWQQDTAGVLVQRKRDFKALCHHSSRQHFTRLSQGVSNAMESSSAHLDLLSDMRWINTQVASIGYDVLPESEDSGDEAAEQLIKHPE